MILSDEPVIFVVDDDPAARVSLAALIKSRGLCVESFGSAEEFLAAYRPGRRGCLLVDVRMTGMSGLDLQERLAELQANLPVIVITGFADVPMAVRAMRAGATSFLEKPCTEQEISDAIQTGLDAEAKANRLWQKREEIAARFESLSSGEREVLDRILAGSTNKVIAKDLNLGMRTVELRRANIMEKMGAGSLPDLVRRVLLVHPNDEPVPED
jgi:two-component system response regulator FixJ